MSHSSNQSEEELLASEFQRIQLHYYNQIAALQRSQVSQSCENSSQFPSNQQGLTYQPSFTQELLETDFTQLGLSQPTNLKITQESVPQSPNQKEEQDPSTTKEVGKKRKAFSYPTIPAKQFKERKSGKDLAFYKSQISQNPSKEDESDSDNSLIFTAEESEEPEAHFSKKITFAEEPTVEAPDTKKIIEQESSLEQEVIKELNKVPICNCTPNNTQIINKIVTKISHKLDKSQKKQRAISLRTFIAEEWKNFEVSHSQHLELTKQILARLDLLEKSCKI